LQEAQKIPVLIDLLKRQHAVNSGNQTRGDDMNLEFGSMEDLNHVTSIDMRATKAGWLRLFGLILVMDFTLSEVWFFNTS
jgi:hypothetical protein